MSLELCWTSPVGLLTNEVRDPLQLKVMTDLVDPVSSNSDVSGYPTPFDSSTCTRRGMCPVTAINKKDSPLQSHSLYYEIHGPHCTFEYIVSFVFLLNTSLSYTVYK